VPQAEISDFREHNAYWIRGWERFGAVEDQVRFGREWSALRGYAAERGVRLLGDVAFYVAPRSADQRAHPEMFQREAVAGVPPDAFSDSGQLWGNPLYDWRALRRDGYRWWVERLRRTLELFDVVRLDHFRGFVAYWAVPRGEPTALHGRWRRGPGMDLFDVVDSELGGLPFVAEDLGVITPAVGWLRDQLRLPGMLVLQFGFEPHAPLSPHRPANHVEHRIVYTGTHDHDTARGWYESLDRARRRLAARSGVSGAEPWWELIRLAFSSPARVAMVQAQDVLGLGSDARMNDPGRPRRRANWRWRLEPGSLTRALAARLREASEAEGRVRVPSG
jgi:4-alpha-glucanotransferase